MIFQTSLEKRETMGYRPGIIGILGNLTLFFIKVIAGYCSNSISVIADAYNSLDDFIASFIIIIFAFIESKTKENNVLKYKKIEYICSFLISNVILYTSFSVAKSSILRLIAPKEIHISFVTIGILIISILIKLLLALYINFFNKTLINPSSTLSVLFKDNISDILVTTVTLVGILLSSYTYVPIDSILGMFIFCIIFISGMTSFYENISLIFC